MAELDVGRLTMTIEADGRAAIFELNRVREAAEGASTDAQRQYQSAGRGMAEGLRPAGDAAEDVAEELRNAGEEAEEAGRAVEGAADQSTRSLQSAAQSAEKFGSTMSKVVTIPLMALYGTMVKGASDLTETVGKTEVVFGDFSGDVMEWSEGAVNSMGLAQRTALDMASTFGDMATGMGLNQAAASEMSTSLTQLAADLASFKNISADRAAQALTGVYTGETEALKSLGVVMTQANLQAYALSQGITTQVSAMSQAEQVQLRYRYVLAQTANAQGDYVRTGGNLANQSRSLVQTLKQTGDAFGKLLTPAITEVVGWLKDGATYIMELDDRTKTMILSIGGVIAVAGPLILAGTKVVGMIKAINLALTTTPVGWIIAAIAAITAGTIALYNALDDANSAVDTTSEKYKALKRDMQKGPVAKATLNTDDLEKDITITIDADTEQALVKAKGVLTTLKSEEYKGKLTIDGDPEKANAAIAALDAAVEAMLTGEGSVAELQAAVTACEELTISPDMDEDKRKALQAKLDSLKITVDALKDVTVTFAVKEAEDSDRAKWDEFHAKIDSLGWTKKEYTAIGKFAVDEMAIANAEEYAEALTAAATATNDYEAAVSNLNNILEQNLAEQVAAINAEAAEEIFYNARLLNSGLIDQATYDANIKTITDGANEAIKSLEAQYEIQKQLNEQLDNGIRADDYKVVGQQFIGLSGGATVTEEDYQSAVATLSAAQRAGEDMTQYQLEAMVVNGQLTQQALENYDALIAAQEAYEAAVDTANKQQENTVKANEPVLENAELMAEAVNLLSNKAGKYLTTTEEKIAYAARTVADGNKELEEAVKQQLQSDLIDPETGGRKITFDALESYYVTMQEEAKAAIEQAEADGATARTTAAENFAATLETLTGDLTAAETMMLLEMTASTGKAIDAETAALIAAVEATIDGAAQEMKDGTQTAADEVSEMIAAIDDEKTAATTAGTDVGEAVTGGIVVGLRNGEGAMYATMRNLVNNMIEEGKKTAEINSPSRRSGREIGLPIVQGVGSGVNKGTPSVVQIMHKSVDSIISGGAQVVNRGAFTIPTVEAVGTPIDYDRMGAALGDAVREIELGIDINGRRFARATQADAAKQRAIRAHETNIARGRVR